MGMRRILVSLISRVPHATCRSLPPSGLALELEATSVIGQLVARRYASKGDGGVGRKSRTQDLIDALSPGTEEATWTEEELADAAKRAKEYSRQKMREHRLWQKQFMTKVKLRDAAVDALPTEELRAAARTPDLTPFPSQRQVWMETPAHEQGTATGGDESKQDKRRRKIGTKM